MNGDELPEVRAPLPGPRSRALAERLLAVESPAFEARRSARALASGASHAPIVYRAAHGSNVVDVDGNRYVDLVSGFGAILLGHGSKEVARAVAAQSERLVLALGDVYGSDTKAEACERIAALFPVPGARVMLGLSGADAVTCALKTAVLATGKAGVVAFEGAYHGLSHGPLAACGLNPAFREPFAAQLGDHVVFAPYPSSDEALGPSLGRVRAALATGSIGAVLVEPVLGRGGCVVPPAAFLPELRHACDASGALLVADEIWTGLGRSGAILASAERGVVCDLVCLGKGLGGGHPISACVGTRQAMAAWGAHGGSAIHTATHFGSPVACAAATATLDAIRDRELPERAATVGASFLRDIEGKCVGRAARVRGRGLMIGIELDSAARALAVSRALLARGYLVLTGGARGDTLTLSPALTIAESLLAAFASTLAEVLSEEAR